jgi:nitroreductase
MEITLSNKFIIHGNALMLIVLRLQGHLQNLNILYQEAMMKLNEIIEIRRSIRKFDGAKKVDKKEVENALEAAVKAPSWKNKQTSRYYVVMKEEMLKKLKDCLIPQNRVNVSDAPVLIVTTFVKDISGYEANGEPSNELGNGWGVYDLGLQNALFLLKATELGLDTLVMGLRSEEEIRRLLEVPEEEVIASVIGLGYRVEDSKMPKRKAVEEIARFF